MSLIDTKIHIDQRYLQAVKKFSITMNMKINSDYLEKVQIKRDNRKMIQLFVVANENMCFMEVHFINVKWVIYSIFFFHHVL